jgi:hypothetical protein
MLGSTTTSTKKLKLIVPKNYTSLATSSTLSPLKLKVFSILPKNTKKEAKRSKKHKNYDIQTNILSLITLKVFSILPNKREKNTQKYLKNKITQNRTKISPKTRTKTLEHKILDITHTPSQNKNKAKTKVIVLIKTSTETKKTHHYSKSKPKNKKINIIQKNIRKNNKTKPNIKKSPSPPNTKRKILKYTFHNKKSILTCGDIESNPGPKFTLLLNHLQDHLKKHKTYFYKNTTQIKNKYVHILEIFKPYLNLTHTENSNPHLKQFCINNQQCPHNHLFFAILITLAPTPTQCNQLISGNSTRWTLILLSKIINHTTPIPSEPHPL